MLKDDSKLPQTTNVNFLRGDFPLLELNVYLQLLVRNADHSGRAV
jgi:hypothetical protein